MVVDREIKRLVDHIVHGEFSTIFVFGNPVSVSLSDSDTKVSLSAPIYEGGNYIPKSVRECLVKKAPFQSHLMRTFFKVDEERFHISLHYSAPLAHLEQHEFKEILEEFGSLAEEWRLYLDDHDKRDLIYVPVK